jgi:hypothetical protein
MKYYYGNQIKASEVDRACDAHGRVEKCKPEGKRPFCRPKHKWKDNINTVLRKVGWEVMSLSHLVHYRVQWQDPLKKVMNTQVPEKEGNFLIS